MSDSQLEKHIKNKVDGHISPIDADALWTDIQQKQKEPMPYWRMFGALALLILLGGGIAFYLIKDNGSKQSLSDNSTIAENIQPTLNSKNSNDHKDIEEESKNQSNDISPAKTTVETSNKALIDAKEKMMDTKANKPISKSKTPELQASNKKPNNELRLAGKFSSNQFGVEKVFKPKESSKSLSNNLLSNQKIDNEPKAKNIESIKLKQFNNQSKLSVKTKSVTDKKTILPKTNKDVEITETNQKQKKLSLPKSNDKLNHKKAIQLLKTRTKSLDNNFLITLSDLKPNMQQMCLPKRRPLFELGLYSNYEYAFRQFTNARLNDSIFTVNDSLIQSYIQTRNDSETFVESYRAGLFLRKSLKQGFRITAGLEYAQLTERFDANINLGQFMVYSMLDSSKQIIVERKNIKKIYNRHKTYNLPILIGKKFSGQSWSFWIDMGIALNLKVDNTGQLFADGNKEEILNLNANEPSIFKDKTGINYLVNMGFAYSFKNGLSVELGPHFQSTFSSVNQNYLLDTKYYYLGFKVSLVKEF